MVAENTPPTEDDDGDDAAEDEEDINNDDGEDDDDDVVMPWPPADVADCTAVIPLGCKGCETPPPTGRTNLEGLVIALGIDCNRIGVFPLPMAAVAAAAGVENVTCAIAGCPTGSMPIFSATPSALRGPFI